MVTVGPDAPGSTPTSRRLLLVHAHPDDETITCGATMARYAAEGVAVTLVTCTLGEEGEVFVPELGALSAEHDDTLGPYRVGELAEAMRRLGVTDHRFLGGPGRYRDSGMVGTPANDRPDCFWQADLREAADHLVPVVRAIRPHVLVTYDERGGYGHPDHVQAHRVATYGAALAAAGSYRRDLGPAWDVPKIYWTAMPHSALREGRRRVLGSSTPFLDPGTDDLDAYGVPDDQVTTCVDAGAHGDAKAAALRAHATQVAVAEPFFALTNNVGQYLWATEWFRLVKGRLGPPSEQHGLEDDLFAGLA